MTTERIPFSSFPAAALEGMWAINSHLKNSSLGPILLELVKLRASQINGCAYCVDMHYKEARAAGESEQRLYGLSAWREAPYYNTRERAALAWTEAVTKLGPRGVEDTVWDDLRSQFSREEMADLTVAIMAINGWNRWAIAMRPKAGDYQVER